MERLRERRVGDFEIWCAESARRAKMTEHERIVEDLHEEFTEAVQHGTINEFFMRIAAEKLELARLRRSDRESRSHAERLVRSLRRVKHELDHFVEVHEPTHER